MLNKKILKFGTFILEKVYLKNTIFDKYEFIAHTDSNEGIFRVDVKNHGNMDIHMQVYGEPSNKQFILRFPQNASSNIDKELFSEIITTIIYILNKNELNYSFKLDEVKQEKYVKTLYALISVNKQSDIQDIERLSQTTKIVNAKITDIGDMDKLIYLTEYKNISEDADIEECIYMSPSDNDNISKLKKILSDNSITFKFDEVNDILYSVVPAIETTDEHLDKLEAIVSEKGLVVDFKKSFVEA